MTMCIATLFNYVLYLVLSVFNTYLENNQQSKMYRTKSRPTIKLDNWKLMINKKKCSNNSLREAMGNSVCVYLKVPIWGAITGVKKVPI